MNLKGIGYPRPIQGRKRARWNRRGLHGRDLSLANELLLRRRSHRYWSVKLRAVEGTLSQHVHALGSPELGERRAVKHGTPEGVGSKGSWHE